jgi:CheY-like chemotaxis protein
LGQNGNFKILLVDDSKDDAFFVEKALNESGMGQSLNIVESAEEAILYLTGTGRYSERSAFPFPTVILSDLKMPRMSGFELLRWVRQHPECGVIPTILFSSSAIEADVVEAYRLGANAYMVKPTVLEEFIDLLRLTCEYWTRCERPPARQKC